MEHRLRPRLAPLGATCYLWAFTNRLMSCDSKAGRNAGRRVQTQTPTVPSWSWYRAQRDACKRQKRALGPRGRELARGLGWWGQMWMTEPAQRM